MANRPVLGTRHGRSHTAIPSVVARIENIQPAPRTIRFNYELAKQRANENPGQWVCVARRATYGLKRQIATGVLIAFKDCYKDYEAVSRKREGYQLPEVDVYIRTRKNDNANEQAKV